MNEVSRLADRYLKSVRSVDPNRRATWFDVERAYQEGFKASHARMLSPNTAAQQGPAPGSFIDMQFPPSEESSPTVTASNSK